MHIFYFNPWSPNGLYDMKTNKINTWKKCIASFSICCFCCLFENWINDKIETAKFRHSILFSLFWRYWSFNKKKSEIYLCHLIDHRFGTVNPFINIVKFYPIFIFYVCMALYALIYEQLSKWLIGVEWYISKEISI